MINWRKINRILHRDLGYIFFGMTIIYSVSGIVLNHKTPAGDASFITKTKEFIIPSPVSREDVNKTFILEILSLVEENSYKQYYFPSSGNLMVYLDNGHISLNLNTGSGRMIKVRPRPFLWEFNFLHYNKPKRLWTWFSDIFAVSLILVSITGLFILKGRQSITRRGAVLTLSGIFIPLIFLFIYLWAA